MDINNNDFNLKKLWLLIQIMEVRGTQDSFSDIKAAEPKQNSKALILCTETAKVEKDSLKDEMFHSKFLER